MPQLPNVWTDPFETEISTTLRLDAACRFRKFQLPETLEAWKKLRPRIRKQFLNAIRLDCSFQHFTNTSVHLSDVRSFTFCKFEKD